MKASDIRTAFLKFFESKGHAVVASTAELGAVGLDEFGLDAAPGSLNEGYADYFAEAHAGDPLMGEYAGRGFGAAGALSGSGPRSVATAPTPISAAMTR